MKDSWQTIDVINKKTHQLLFFCNYLHANNKTTTIMEMTNFNIQKIKKTEIKVKGYLAERRWHFSAL